MVYTTIALDFKENWDKIVELGLDLFRTRLEKQKNLSRDSS